jgi:BirA family biotin operon repressor/biotin-[acetyl-CoA-carboxylase] ligase
VLFHVVPADAGELARRVSLAALDAVRARRPDADVRLKWPNDILLDGAKVAGLLAQRDATGAVVVGIGINVGWAPAGAAQLGEGIERADLLARMLAAYDALAADPADVSDRYRRELATIGQRVRVETPSGPILGTATDVTATGRLVLRDDNGAVHEIDVGDVTHLRPA